MAWAKLSHRGVLWLQCLQVLWSLGYGKDNVLLLHPKLKVKVVEISSCLTDWIRFMEELLVIHFFLHKKHGLLPVFFKLGSSRSPQESHLEKSWGTYGEIVKQAVFFSTRTIRNCVCSSTQWARDGSLAWISKSMAWLSCGAELTLLPPREPRHLGHAACWKQLTFAISQTMLKQIWEGRSWQEPNPGCEQVNRGVGSTDQARALVHI